VSLAFALALLPISLTAYLSLKALNVPDANTQATFYVVVLVTGILGLYFLINGIRAVRQQRRMVDELLESIKSRLDDSDD
jgi:hypothetical protein